MIFEDVSPLLDLLIEMGASTSRQMLPNLNLSWIFLRCLLPFSCTLVDVVVLEKIYCFSATNRVFASVHPKTLFAENSKQNGAKAPAGGITFILQMHESLIENDGKMCRMMGLFFAFVHDDRALSTHRYRCLSDGQICSSWTLD